MPSPSHVMLSVVATLIFAIAFLWIIMALAQTSGCVRCDCISQPSRCK